MSSKPVYVIAGPGPFRDACATELSGSLELLDPPLDLDDLRERAPGIVLAASDGLSANDLLVAADALPGPDWTLALYGGGDVPTVRTVSVGYGTGLAQVGRFAQHEGDGAEDLLDLHRVLAEVARARHDINNPLTSALAETQILLLDVPGGEVGEGLEIVQTQLRRIRDLVAATRHLRPHKGS